MNVERQNMGLCRVKLVVKADAAETRPDYEEVVKAFLTQGRVKGFRPGKVPREIIQREFRQQIEEEVHGRLVRSLYKRAVEQENLKLVALLEVGEVAFSPESGIRFSFTADVEPEFDLPKYVKIPVPFEEPVVTDDQVEEHLNRLRGAFARFEEAPEGYPVAAGDLVSIDFSGSVGGRPVSELAPEAKAVSEGKDFWFQVEEGRFLPEVVSALEGMRAGEAKEVKAAFGKDHPLEALRGKKADYQVTLKGVRQRALPSDEELLKQVKAESLEAFRAQARQSLEEAAQAAEQQRREQAVVEYLLKKTDFDLPETEVSDEISRTIDRMASEAHYRGLKREDLEKNREAIIENATASAKRQLKLRYVLRAIADKEKITASDEEVNQKLEALASEHRMKVEQLRAQLEKSGRMGLLSSQIVGEKTMQALLAQAKH